MLGQIINNKILQKSIRTTISDKLKDKLLYKKQLFIIIFFGLINTYEISQDVFQIRGRTYSGREYTCTDH